MRSLVALILFAAAALAQNGEPRAGTLKTKVDPGRAGVFIDGKYVGSAANFKRARSFNLNAGEHEVTLVDPRYEEFKTKVTVRAGETVTLSQKLTKLAAPQGPFGRIRVTGFDKFAAVFLNTKFYGHADEVDNFAQGLLIPTGEYTMRVESVNGGSPQEEKIKVEAGKTVIVKKK